VVRVCHYFLNQNHIRVLPLSALSPDPNEHLWDELGRRVIHHQNPPETPQELRDALVLEWNNIPQAFIQRLSGEPHDILHCHVERRDQSFAVAERAER
jgi:hypothetical protein